MRVITNNVPRDVIHGFELTQKEREEFDHIDWEAVENDRENPQFFRYKKELHYLGDFLRWDTVWTAPKPDWADRWHGFRSDSFFSGLVVRYVDDYERVVVGLMTVGGEE